MDFNIRSKDEQLYTEDPEVIGLLELFLQEIDILFTTEPGTIYGQRDVGIAFERLLWQTKFRPSYLESIVTQGIKKDCYTNEEFKWKVDVELVKGNTQDIGLVTIHIKDADGMPIAQKQFLYK